MPRFRPEILGRRSRPLKRTFERRRAVKSERYVEALDTLARGPLDEVVEGGGHNGLLALRRDVDQAPVGVAGQLGVGGLVDYFRERLLGIELAIGVFQCTHRTLELEVARGEDAARHRHEV